MTEVRGIFLVLSGIPNVDEWEGLEILIETVSVTKILFLNF